MVYKTRNLYYLRISEHSVLPAYLYLDERHLDWMSDQVLQHVLSDLRPRILPKLLAETVVFVSPATAKRAVVDTYRGDTYQFCYFLRQTEPHSVAIKTRNYIARTQIPSRSTYPSTAATAITSPPQKTQRKRKTRSGPGSFSLNSPAKKQKKDAVFDLDDSEDSEGGEPLSTRPRVLEVVDVDQDEEMIDTDMEEGVDKEDEAWNPRQDDSSLHADEEEKPKPALQLKYKGFSIYARPLQEIGGITSLKSKEKRVATPSVSTIRAQTPLFLADEDNAQAQQSIPVTNPWDDLETMEDSDDDSEIGGMMAFSQALNLAGDTRPGAVEEDDDMEGAVFFGDADEARQL